jgi:hypothetical protein
MPKVFVSSTVYDLIDARAEVEHLLREMRLIPVVSGSATSGFQPLTDRNSIETCLANLRQCDAVIVILCQRYGPTLEAAGFPDVSATHLEYNEARSVGKPIHMYVRDRLEADYCIRKKNTKGDVQPLWVREQRDQRLFDLLEEHRKLAKGKPGSNWIDIFRDSLELKTLVKRDFGPIATRNELEALVVENRVPIIAVKVDIDPQMNRSLGTITINIRFRNVGTVPAYKFSWSMDSLENEGLEMPVLAPQQETQQSLLYAFDGREWKRDVTMTYYLPQGHCVCDAYTVGIRPMGGGVLASGATCTSKCYRVASGEVRPFVITEG